MLIKILKTFITKILKQGKKKLEHVKHKAEYITFPVFEALVLFRVFSTFNAMPLKRRTGVFCLFLVGQHIPNNIFGIAKESRIQW